MEMNSHQASQSQRSSPRTSPQTSHSSHLPPIREELQPPTTREKRLLKSLPPRQPQQHTQQMRRLSSLKALPQVRQSSSSYK